MPYGYGPYAWLNTYFEEACTLVTVSCTVVVLAAQAHVPDELIFVMLLRHAAITGCTSALEAPGQSRARSCLTGAASSKSKSKAALE